MRNPHFEQQCEDCIREIIKFHYNHPSIYIWGILNECASYTEYLSDLYDWIQTDTEGSGKPFLITETGAGAIYGYRTPTHVKWSEEYQAEALNEQIVAIFEQEGCNGIYVWQFCDVRVCYSWFDKRPRTMNNKGIVDEYRRPKLAYETVKKWFDSKGNYR